jgi:hypothetical protein
MQIDGINASLAPATFVRTGASETKGEGIQSPPPRASQLIRATPNGLNGQALPWIGLGQTEPIGS